MIKGILKTPLKVIAHPMGDIYHAIRNDSEGYQGFGELYISTVTKGEVKGWKKHHQMTLNLVVPHGEVDVVVFDDRRSSPTNGEFEQFNLSIKNYFRLTIAPELWVAFKGVSSEVNMLLNFANIPHVVNEAESIELNDLTYIWDKE